MSQTQQGRRKARSALKTVINSSKRTTRVSSPSPPHTPTPHYPSRLRSLPLIFKKNNAGAGWRQRDGLSWVNLQGALMAGGCKVGEQLCCLLGLSPGWALIKSRPWCEAFGRSSDGLLNPLCFSEEIVQSQRSIFFPLVFKLLLFTFFVSNTRLGWMLMLFTDELHTAVGLQE